MWNTAPTRVLLLGTDTAGTYTGVTATQASIWVDVTAFREVAFILTSIGTTSGGTILLEEADWDPTKDSPYSGTWSQMASVLANSFTGGQQTIQHFSPNVYAYVRVRISGTIIGGGSIWAALRMV